jgi:myo-inositol-1(or 4)-monophosphatase
MRDYLEFIAETAFLAGRRTLSYFQTGVVADFKSDRSPVTQADKEAEQIIRARINRYFPDHAILGEEFGVQGGSNAACRWIIDPIDGTKSFLRGIPLFGVLIGLEIEGKPVAGAACYPAMDELVAAADGEGCWWNGRRAHVSTVSDLGSSWVTCTDPGGFSAHGKEDAWQRIMKAAYVRGGWSDAFGYLLVATGRAEVMMDPVMEVWDCGPFVTILSEAGGYFGDWKGNRTLYGREGLATNAVLLPQVLALLQGG